LLAGGSLTAQESGGRMFDRKQLYLSIALLGLAEVVAVFVISIAR
jgi:ABC-type branched-subunit amino acid transport system permease subunit